MDQQNKEQKENNIQPLKFEISESQRDDMKYFKPMCIKAIDEIIEQFEGENKTDKEAIKIKKNLKRFYQEVLNNFKNHIAITGKDKITENQLIKQENIIYTEKNEQLKEQVEQKKQELLSVIQKYEQKKLREEVECRNKVLLFVNQNFPNVEQQQETDISKCYLKCKNINKSGNKTMNEENNQQQSNENENNLSNNNSVNSQGHKKITESTQNMSQFVQDFVTSLNNQFQPQIREIEILDNKIQKNNKSIIKKMKNQINQIDQIKALQKLDLLK